MKKTENSMPSHNTFYVISFGLLVIFSVFGLLGGWMYYAPLASSSVAIGKVSAGSAKKSVQHLEGGIVEAIHVKDGDVVKKGDVLVELEEIQIKERLNILEVQYQNMIALYARLKAQRDDKKSITFSTDSTDKTIMQDEKNIFITTKKSMQDEETINRQRIVQLRSQISGLKSLLGSKDRRIKSISVEIKEWKILFEQRLVDKLRIRELERENNMIEGDIANTRSEIARLQEQISEVKTQQLLRKKEFLKEVLNQMVAVKSQMSDVKSKIIATQDTLNRTTILSPADGTIIGLSIETIGGVVSPGKEIMGIVPETSKLIIIAQVNTTDIDKVKVGLLSDVMFSAFDMRQVNVIEGKVIHVSADSFINEVTGAPYYEAKIELTPKGIKQLKEYKFTLVAGMPAEVMIKIGDRTALSYLIKPFKDMIVRGFNEE
ncbi:MAG TPA: HlyD family type I secretion periplasmic adaptor subunit [Campylobacterales bacterium]|nr:HlyD family type I secretion periplasmic adaptor subunit [Campylobacterales bacterium]HIP42292.1 HlyD family type I secretion periplasmic adaptor subunit [Campylobacterales bacterium]